MKKIICIQLCLIIFISFAQAGGPWPQKKGKGYVKLSESWMIFNQHFTIDGELEPNITTGVFNTGIYGEYGFTNKLTGIVNFTALARNYTNNLRSSTTQEILIPGETVNSLGDLDLGVKYGFTKAGAKVPISATLILGIPTGKNSAGSMGQLQTGDGEFNQMLQVDAGTSFQLGKKKKVNSYATAYLGFNHRTNDFSEEFRYGVEYGAGFMGSKLWLVGRVNALVPFENGDAPVSENINLYSNNVGYFSFNVEAAYYVTKKLGFSASYGGALAAQNIAAAPIYSVGVFLDLSK